MDRFLLYGDIAAGVAFIVCVIYLLFAQVREKSTTNALGTLVASLVWILVRIVEGP